MRAINRQIKPGPRLLLGALPFLLVIIAYLAGSAIRLADNPSDKLLPALTTMADAIDRMAFTPDKRTGEILWWVDTVSSLARIGVALAFATVISLVVGIAVGLLPIMRALMSSFIAVISMVPPLAILPILFIMLGLGETSKVTLIVIGIAPVMIRDLALRTEEMPTQQLIKAQTLGASTFGIVQRVVLPQLLPRLIDSIRLNMGPAWLFLIAAEAIASESGLGYRIFLVRRYLAMDVILPYVAWITLLAFLMDYSLRALQDRMFPWFAGARAS
ncbi:ABC transporter permease subunit [Zavarzinia compransoris]|uniref:ABC transporter permease n=1 Tax=Zavarzinia marina TaxID=2911065 RepID=UPI001F21E4E4|nr:ABC transporter permease subunit [Zavarzinia marina]MCF4166756.1 ABC transporter permease subunit [Zavarzinia marina]